MKRYIVMVACVLLMSGFKCGMPGRNETSQAIVDAYQGEREYIIRVWSGGVEVATYHVTGQVNSVTYSDVQTFLQDGKIRKVAGTYVVEEQ